MKIKELTLRADELEPLTRLIGSNWVGCGADVLFQGRLADVDMSVETDTDSLTLGVRVVATHLQGWVDGVTTLEIGPVGGRSN